MDMSIGADDMLMQMVRMRMQAAGPNAVMSGAMPNNEVQSAGGADFAAMLKSAVEGVNDLQVNSSNLKTNFELGDRSVSLAEVMIAGQKAGLALEATIQVRNKMVETYKTIMQMQI